MCTVRFKFLRISNFFLSSESVKSTALPYCQFMPLNDIERKIVKIDIYNRISVNKAVKVWDLSLR